MRILWLVVTLHFGAPLGSLIVPNKHLYCEASRLSNWLTLTDYKKTQGLPRSGTPPTFRSRRGLPEKRKIRDVKKVVAVSSAKGGVGKSTIAGMLTFFVPIYVSSLP
jgi:hypothetical protein